MSHRSFVVTVVLFVLAKNMIKHTLYVFLFLYIGACIALSNIVNPSSFLFWSLFRVAVYCILVYYSRLLVTSEKDLRQVVDFLETVIKPRRQKK